MTVGDGGNAQKLTLPEHDSDDDEEPVPLRPLLPLSELSAKLNDLQKVPVEGCVADALHNIRKLQSLFVTAKIEEARKRTRQLLIT